MYSKPEKFQCLIVFCLAGTKLFNQLCCHGNTVHSYQYTFVPCTDKFILRYTFIHSFILFIIRKKCLNSGRLLYGYKMDCSNYRGLSLLGTTHTHTHTVSSNLLLNYTLYVKETTGVHHCRFQCNR
jgi:hypothetical protein